MKKKKQTLTESQMENLDNLKKKFDPLADKEYILTDQCFWETNPPENYNPLDPNRAPHSVSLVDKETGTIVMLKSGSIIKIIKAN